MVLCRYYQQGKCRYGENCRNEHPVAQNGRNAGLTSQNRFGVLRSLAGSGANHRIEGRGQAPWAIDVADITNDLTAGKGRPEWILSAYGPTKNAPASLLESHEISFEELRQHFYDLRSSGNEAQAMNEAIQLWAKAESDIAAILENVERVVPFMEEKDRTRPNRYDFSKMTGTVTRDEVIEEAELSKPLGQSFTNPPPLGLSSQPTFGQPGLNQPSIAPAFGNVQPAQPSGFSQPAFGQPSFGQPSNSGLTLEASSQHTSGFGQPSFGQPPQPSQPSTGFGQSSQTGSGFGAHSNQPGAFGQASSAPSVFGGGPTAPSPFGHLDTSTLYQPTKPSSGFGQVAQPAIGFGQPSQIRSANNAASPFDRSRANLTNDNKPANPFGSGNTTNTASGQPAQPAPSSSADHSNQFLPASNTAPVPATSPMVTTSASAQAPALIATTSTSNPHPLTSRPPTPLHYTQTLPAGQNSIDSVSKRLAIFKSRPVKYINAHPCYERPDGKGAERIWFPNGPDTVRLEDVHMKDGAVYDLPEVKEAYKVLAETGRFEMGKMPVVPPKREWVGFDF